MSTSQFTAWESSHGNAFNSNFIAGTNNHRALLCTNGERESEPASFGQCEWSTTYPGAGAMVMISVLNNQRHSVHTTFACAKTTSAGAVFWTDDPR